MTALNDCGCCQGLTLETPAGVTNRPGLSAIAYRAGTHEQFKASILTRLSADMFPALAKLKTRANDDFTIVLADSWALVADILTFYQERIANESYLRTATERTSIINLARLIGYELRPGVAASTYLAFTLESGPGAPAAVTLEEGLKVQSLPGPGQKPQTFETVEEIDARPEWNVLTPRLTKLVLPKKDATQMLLADVTTNLKAGDSILFVASDNPVSAELRKLTSVEPDAANNRTLVRWIEPLKQPAVKVYAMRLRTSLFGYNAPKWKALPVALRVGELDPTRPLPDPTKPLLDGVYAGREDDWADTPLKATTASLNLDSVYNTIVTSSYVVLFAPADLVPRAGRGRNTEDAMAVYAVEAVGEEAKADFNISAKTTRLAISSGEEIAKFSPRNTTVFAQSEELIIAETPITEPVSGDTIVLDRIVTALEPGRKLIVSGTTVRRLVAEQVDLPLNERIATPTFPSGIAVFGGDAPGSEVVELKAATDDGTRTTLTLTKALSNSYVRTSVSIFANVAFSTHGETVANEILGSGNAGKPYQSFTLHEAPLTYTPADTATGGESTLEVRVNDLLWHEAPTLFGRGPRERIYLTHIADDGTVTVQFGDGKTGARLPAGHENVKATYRKGIGVEGLVDAGQLSLLMSRPLGLKGVTNPQAPAGAQDPQDLDDARENSPVTVLTLDRIVSLRDYEDFARAFSGISKALATWTWSGHTRRIFVTVAGVNGADVKDGSSLQTSLVSAMQKAGDPFVPIAVRSYRKATFTVAANLRVDADYIQADVIAAGERALRSAFSFHARAFGQAVTLSEVIAVMQNVAGVVSVDVNTLRRTDGRGTSQTFLASDSPIPGAGAAVLGAELLTLDPGPIQLAVVS